MKFKHVKRNGFFFVVLSILTLGIFDLVVLSHVGKEINEIDTEDKKSCPFWVMWVLSFITLGIVAVVWFARVADKVNKAAAKEGTPCSITYEKMFGWNLFGIFIIVGPFIAWVKFFRALNALEAKLNEGEKTVAEETKEVPEEAAAPVEEKEEEPQEVEEKAEEKEPVKEEPKKAPYKYVTEEKEEEPVEEKIEPVPQVNPASRTYHVTRRSEVRKWAVRYANGAKAVKLFDTQAEAVAYAKMLATKKGVSVRVHGKNGKMRRF